MNQTVLSRLQSKAREEAAGTPFKKCPDVVAQGHADEHIDSSRLGLDISVVPSQRDVIASLVKLERRVGGGRGRHLNTAGSREVVDRGRPC
ncbi:hypothetical protein HYQ46_007295 [Verticillium longisporum]|nr:hypothetical protein HYQ46_007295 [Verticillium longisporum]